MNLSELSWYNKFTNFQGLNFYEILSLNVFHPLSFLQRQFFTKPKEKQLEIKENLLDAKKFQNFQLGCQSSSQISNKQKNSIFKNFSLDIQESNYFLKINIILGFGAYLTMKLSDQKYYMNKTKLNMFGKYILAQISFFYFLSSYFESETYQKWIFKEEIENFSKLKNQNQFTNLGHFENKIFIKMQETVNKYLYFNEEISVQDIKIDVNNKNSNTNTEYKIENNLKLNENKLSPPKENFYFEIDETLDEMTSEMQFYEKYSNPKLDSEKL